MNGTLQVAAAYYSRLSPRERRVLGLAGVTCGLALGYVLVVSPLGEARARLEARIAAKERHLDEVRALRRTYMGLRRRTGRTAQSTAAKDFSLFSYLEGLAASTVGREKMSAMNPLEREPAGKDRAQTATVELRLTGVSLRELVDLLYKIEQAPPGLRTLRLAVKKRFKDPHTFDITLVTEGPGGGAPR